MVVTEERIDIELETCFQRIRDLIKTKSVLREFSTEAKSTETRFVGTILECCKYILKNKPEGMFVFDIFQEVQKGRPTIKYNSVYSCVVSHKDIFERTGKSKYKLKEPDA